MGGRNKIGCLFAAVSIACLSVGDVLSAGSLMETRSVSTVNFNTAAAVVAYRLANKPDWIPGEKVTWIPRAADDVGEMVYVVSAKSDNLTLLPTVPKGLPCNVFETHAAVGVRSEELLGERHHERKYITLCEDLNQALDGSVSLRQLVTDGVDPKKARIYVDKFGGDTRSGLAVIHTFVSTFRPDLGV